MSVNITMKCDFKSLKLEERIRDNIPSAKKAVLEEMVKDTEPYIPYKTGRLSESVSVDTESDSIVYDTAYAGYSFTPTYRGKPKVYDTSVHPQAQGNPYKASSDENMEKWTKLFTEKLLEGIDDDNTANSK